MNIIPKVTIKGGILKAVTNPPVVIPIPAQRRMAARLPIHKCEVLGAAPPKACMVKAAITPLKAMRLPTERSMPAVMMTSVMPMAMIATTETCLRTLSKLSFFRKLGQRWVSVR